MKAIRIGRFSLEERVLMVAEIGNNHEGDIAVAERLVREAAAAGVDAVKFQTYQTDLFVSPTRTDQARRARLKSFQLSYAHFAALEQLSRSLGLAFISTPLDLESARFLATIVDAIKIASGDNDFFPLIAFACSSGKPVIISTGLVDLAHVERVVRFADESFRAAMVEPALAVLHCVASYPVPANEANLAAISVLTRTLPCTVGYSDHTIGPAAAALAVAAGARIIEKHFTLDKHHSDFRDHQLSADPTEMRVIVESVRRAEELLGKPEKVAQPCEEATRVAARRSLSAARDLPTGHRISADDLIALRPGGGLGPGEQAPLVGRRLARALQAGDAVLPTDLV